MNWDGVNGKARYLVNMDSKAAGHGVHEGAEGVVIRLDRLIFSAVGRMPIKDIEGFKRTGDFRVRCQGKISTYARVRRFQSHTNSAQITLQYKPQAPWLAERRITVIGDDRRGITPEQVDAVLSQCLNHRLSLVELAVDFLPVTGVDEAFVLRHGRFGKSRRRTDRGGPGQLRYGSRGSAKLVRAYQKNQLACYRVEFECHGSLLRKCSVRRARNLGGLAVNLCPAHIRFAGFRWGKLDTYLARRFGANGLLIGEQARRRADVSLRRAARFLSREGVYNVHRFLRPLPINRDIQLALRRWAERFVCDEEVWVVK